MSRWQENTDGLDHTEIFDPLCIERSAPMGDEEADLLEALCRSATPGPLVIDDEAQGEGAVVATLPDGRMIISLTAAVEHTEDPGAIEANAHLFCKSGNLLLRLLRDRRQWLAQRDFLQERIHTLETALRVEEAMGAGQSMADTVRIAAPR